MPRRLPFLHTSPAHIDTFDRLVRAADPTAKVDHVVAEPLLAEAQRVGIDDPALIERVQTAMTDAASRGAAVVVCTCSTIGGAAERTPTEGRFVAMRVDRAMADRAVQLGSRILIVAALESTLQPTDHLVRESAAAASAEVRIDHLLVSNAWSHFLRGDRAKYAEAIAAAVCLAAGGADVVVLAQASMAPAVDLLDDLGVEVLASPALGVRRALTVAR